MNQLGGVGRGNSQFLSNADGVNCHKEDEDEYLFAQYIEDIRNSIQSQIQYYLTNNASNDEQTYNTTASFELCLVGNKEKFLADIQENSGGLLYTSFNYINNTEGVDISDNIFTHLITGQANYQISLIQDQNGVSNERIDLSLSSDIQDKIKYVNDTIISDQYLADMLELANSQQFGTHTLGILNNNFILDVSSNPDASYNNSSPKELLNLDLYGLINLKDENMVARNLFVYNNTHVMKPQNPCRDKYGFHPEMSLLLYPERQEIVFDHPPCQGTWPVDRNHINIFYTRCNNSSPGQSSFPGLWLSMGLDEGSQSEGDHTIYKYKTLTLRGYTVSCSTRNIKIVGMISAESNCDSCQSGPEQTFRSCHKSHYQRIPVSNTYRVIKSFSCYPSSHHAPIVIKNITSIK